MLCPVLLWCLTVAQRTKGACNKKNLEPVLADGYLAVGLVFDILPVKETKLRLIIEMSFDASQSRLSGGASTNVLGQS